MNAVRQTAQSATVVAVVEMEDKWNVGRESIARCISGAGEGG